MKQLRILALLLCGVPLLAQLPMTPLQVREFQRHFDEGKGGEELRCRVMTPQPFLDFGFRFNIGFFVECPVNQFLEKESANIGMVLRVTPDNGASPTMLGEQFLVPKIPDEIRRKKAAGHYHASDNLQFSGDFNAGEGNYKVELIIQDGNNRRARKNWTVHARQQGKEGKANLALGPGQVQAALLPKWDGPSPGSGLKVSILLDAAPVNPFAMKLRAWDRAFLLGSLSSVLRHLPLASAEVVAFNLDQSAEIFRDSDFHQDGMRKLSGQLQSLELGTINYKKLQRQNSWASLMMNLFSRASGTPGNKPDAIIILGPTSRFTTKLEKEMFATLGAEKIPLFYFEYYPYRGYEFPDALEYMTSARWGTTFRMYSPGDLASSIDKMRRKLEQGIPKTVSPKAQLDSKAISYLTRHSEIPAESPCCN